MNAQFDRPQPESAALQRYSLSDDVPSLVLCAILVVSGLFHLSLVWVMGAEWEESLDT